MPKLQIFTKDPNNAQSYIQTAKDDTTLQNFAGKATAEINSRVRASFTYFRGNKEKEGRGASATRPDETTYNQTGPSDMFKGEVNLTLSNAMYLTARYAHFKNGFSLTPRGGLNTMTYSDDNGVFHNTFYFYKTDRPQDTVSADANYFMGNNEFKFGFSYRKATVTSFSGLPGGGIMYANGYPNYLGYIYRDYNPATEGKYISGYASDTFTHDRFTLNIGARWDYQTSSLLPSTVNANPIAPNLLPVFVIELRKVGVPLGFGIDLAEIDAVGKGQDLAVDVAAANHGNLRRLRGAGHGQGLIDGTRHDGPWRQIARLARDDDVGAARQRFAWQRLPGLPAHDDRLAHGDFLEAPKVRRKPPGQRPVTPDDAIARNGHHENDQTHRASSSSAAPETR